MIIDTSFFMHFTSYTQIMFLCGIVLFLNSIQHIIPWSKKLNSDFQHIKCKIMLLTPTFAFRWNLSILMSLMFSIKYTMAINMENHSIYSQEYRQTGLNPGHQGRNRYSPKSIMIMSASLPEITVMVRSFQVKSEANL